ncbi:MAG TPA: helix-turn-helix transcriptional regulator [Candidatus Limnocylindria bacterium]|nr:helix-turn-helix transcriptional regulator [Candidatus Limnocylindria bacterium]
MGRRAAAARRTPPQAAADRQAVELATRLGKMLRDGRRRRRLTQAQACALAGLSQSTWSQLELGRDGRYTLATWNRAATAVGSSLRAYLERTSAADAPRDAVHLRHQELVIRVAKPGGWKALPEELIDREARTSRAADVVLRRGREYAIKEIWDWFDDLGAALRDWTRRLEALERYAIARMVGDEPLPRTSGCWVVRSTERTRRLVHEHRALLRARFPGSGHAWLRALTDPRTPMPAETALLWISTDGTRLFPARLG